MKAVIMAGGMGTRLKAVSGGAPKPMVPLLGVPIMEHIVSLLREHGFADICAAVKYRAGDIMAYFGDGSRFGVNIRYSLEREALGTAGCVKNCAGFYGDEDFLVISGDAACDFNLEELMAEHRRREAAVTLALYHSERPLSYGLAVTDSDGLIRGFVEKPDWSRVVTDLVNTGIYIVSPRAMELVPQGVPFDFAKDLFPLLLKRGEVMLGLAMSGYWCDIGEPLSYYRCCVDALEGKLRIALPEKFRKAPESGAERAERLAGEVLECPCRSRAELMGTLSELFMDMGADYSDGLALGSERFRLHISPLSRRSAVRVAVESEDAEFAKELAVSAKKLIEALDL